MYYLDLVWLLVLAQLIAWKDTSYYVSSRTLNATCSLTQLSLFFVELYCIIQWCTVHLYDEMHIVEET